MYWVVSSYIKIKSCTGWCAKTALDFVFLPLQVLERLSKERENVTDIVRQDFANRYAL